MIDRDLGILFGADQFGPEARADYQQPARIPGAQAAPELCQLLGRWSVADHPDDAFGQLKADGRRAIYIGGDAGLLVSREGVPMQQCGHSRQALAALERAFGKPMMFDGEYVHPDGLDVAARPGGTIWLFDAVPLNLWMNNGVTAPAIERVEMLLDRGKECFGPALGVLKPLPLGNAASAIALAESLWARGYEGLVVKRRGGRYSRRRSMDWLKVKNWRTQPFRVLEAVVRGGLLSHIVISVQGKPQRFATGVLGREQCGALASLIREGSMVAMEHTGWTSGGLLRDIRFVQAIYGEESK